MAEGRKNFDYESELYTEAKKILPNETLLGVNVISKKIERFAENNNIDPSIIQNNLKNYMNDKSNILNFSNNKDAMEHMFFDETALMTITSELEEKLVESRSDHKYSNLISENLKSLNDINYSNENLYRSYHNDLAKQRINDESIDQNVRMRDEYFKLIEDYGFSRNQNETFLEFYKDEVESETKNININEEDMSEEDREILRQEIESDPTIDDSAEEELLQMYMYHSDLKESFDDILSNIDTNSNEYNDISKVEELISKVSDKDNLIYYNSIDDISLTNSNLDNDISIQIKDEDMYENTYNNVINNNSLDFNIYNYNQEYSLDKQLDKLNNNIGNNLKNPNLENEYSEYKNKAINLVENSTEDLHTIEKELEKYEFASENYHEYLKDKYTDFNQYLKDNNISNPNEKYSDDLIKNAKVYSNIRLKMEEIDDEYFSEYGKHVPNYIDYNEEISKSFQKNENNIDLDDPQLLEKLQDKFKESNEFIKSVEDENIRNNKLKDIKLNYLSETLSVASQNLLEQSNKINNDISKLSEEEKIDLYNHAKDIESLTKDNNNSSYEDMKINLDTIKITSTIENQFGKDSIENERQSYLTSDVKKPSISENPSDNLENLNIYVSNTNNILRASDINDLKKYQINATNELKDIQQNKRANELKNNDLLQKFNNQSQQNIKNNEHKGQYVYDNEKIDNREKKKQSNSLNI
ncbi:hypothetical protein [Staphylococcus sp. GDY8P11P]|uniref:hypothetical protein n=1 Tax=Staphylococcus sp. GDY8P11P TaxID=2804410 RepID=UPI00194F6AB9|nr:hypothetical protein [Staphylococcus sp. GDY8P11P]